MRAPTRLERERPFREELDAIRAAGTYKELRYLQGSTGPVVEVEGKGEVLLLCSNNYLGLADHPEVVAAGHDGLEALRRGHRERALHLRHVHHPPRAGGGARALHRHRGGADLRLAAGTPTRRVIPTARRRGRRHHLRRAQPRQHHRRHSPRQGDAKRSRSTSTPTWTTCGRSWRQHRDARRKLIVTDGVFSMEGTSRELPDICELARRDDAIVMVDDSHGDRRHGRDRPRHGRALRRARTKSTSSPARSARRWAAPPAASSPAAGASSTISSSARARSSSPTPCRRPSPASALSGACEMLDARAGASAAPPRQHAPTSASRSRSAGYQPLGERVGHRADHRRRDTAKAIR